MTFIIAECAQGYLMSSRAESIGLALWLVRAAKASNADAVKFQLIIADELAAHDYKYYDLFKGLELGADGWIEIVNLAKAIDIEIIFDIFGIHSLAISEKLGIQTVKIHPTDFTNTALLRAVAASPIVNKVIAGCGGAFANEILNTLEILSATKSVTLLHGFQGYPTPNEQNCLERLNALKSISLPYRNKVSLGFADHADPCGFDATHLAAAAIGYGVTTLEKHLTLARCLKLEDYESALSPDQLAEFIEIIRLCENSRGDKIDSSNNFQLPPSEMKYRSSIARHIVAARELTAGHCISSEDICLKRTSCAAPIVSIDLVLGKILAKDVLPNEPIILSSLAS